MPWSLRNPHLVYRVPLGPDALRARLLQEATRLRDAFPTRALRLGGARPLILIPYADGFDLLYFTQSQPFGWLSIKVRSSGAISVLDVRRRERPRPERVVLVVIASAVVLASFASVLWRDLRPFISFLPMLPALALMSTIVLLVERRQERRLLDALTGMFPGIAEENHTAWG